METVSLSDCAFREVSGRCLQWKLMNQQISEQVYHDSFLILNRVDCFGQSLWFQSFECSTALVLFKLESTFGDAGMAGSQSLLSILERIQLLRYSLHFMILLVSILGYGQFL